MVKFSKSPFGGYVWCGEHRGRRVRLCFYHGDGRGKWYWEAECNHQAPGLFRQTGWCKTRKLARAAVLTACRNLGR